MTNRIWWHKKFLVVVLSLSVILIVYSIYREKPQNKFSSINMGIDNNQKCRIPQLDPFDPEISSYINLPVLWEKCTIKRYGIVERDKLRLKVEGVLSAFVVYIDRVDDFKNTLSEKMYLCGDDSSYGKGKGRYKLLWNFYLILTVLLSCTNFWFVFIIYHDCWYFKSADPIFIWKKLFTGTVPVNNLLYTGTVPVNNSIYTRTVRVNNSLYSRTVVVNNSLYTGTVSVNNSVFTRNRIDFWFVEFFIFFDCFDYFDYLHLASWWRSL